MPLGPAESPAVNSPRLSCMSEAKHQPFPGKPEATSTAQRALCRGGALGFTSHPPGTGIKRDGGCGCPRGWHENQAFVLEDTYHCSEQPLNLEKKATSREYLTLFPAYFYFYDLNIPDIPHAITFLWGT